MWFVQVYTIRITLEACANQSNGVSLNEIVCVLRQ